MLQISEMDGAVILTFSEPLSIQEKDLIQKARCVDVRKSVNPVGAGGVCWGDCAKKRQPAEQTATRTATITGNPDIDELNAVIGSANTPEELETAMELLGFEEIYDPFDFKDGEVPF